ncbi:MAG: helix-turn-helix transcriptional regulator [Lachnospiraceae bacterium]|jgi:transcriptional regulator with XRE-family HTH domain|nr:helix-turn-helix transcriptional regulator [Lachnospiraceae bacterium]
MIDSKKIAQQIAFLRKERGYTGEALAEKLHVSPQAVSKWENAKCLPETAILPALAQALDCSIDSLLQPKELLILEAFYTDGRAQISVTQLLNTMIRSDRLQLYVHPQLIGAALEGDRLKLLTVKFQTSKGIFFSYALENEELFLTPESNGYLNEQLFEIIGAYYGNAAEYTSAMQKIHHYEYFNWQQIPVNHETFPSSSASDTTEYLTIIYTNADGIHTICCPEGESMIYTHHRTHLALEDHAKHILKNVMPLAFGNGMDCPWAGALCAALQYMNDPYTYQQIMGMSGACYRICFTDVWDYSCTDALVAFDYAQPLFDAIGYHFHMAARLQKAERSAERQAIMTDIQNGKPVLAINLRVAPEWGLITGYLEHGKRFLCRTYFDQAAVLSEADQQMITEQNEGYLFNDFWPFLILHFDEKKERPQPLEILKTSLSILLRSFYAESCGGYHQGKAAYEVWMQALAKDSDFCLEKDRENALRRLSVNDNMLCHLIDSRRCAAGYLRESMDLLPSPLQETLAKIAANCQNIADMAADFRSRLSGCRLSYNTLTAPAAELPASRQEQVRLLERAETLDTESCSLAEQLLKSVEA